MAYELDFLPVGDNGRSGDAIALRYVQDGRWVIHVVDSGDLAAGETMVSHINKYYGNPKRIDAVVLTHPDDDHSSGLRHVIDSFPEIGGIWMNRPWLYAAELLPLFKDPRFTVEGLARRLREDFPIMAEIEDMAAKQRIPIYEAFQGTRIGAFTVLSPSRARYIASVPQFGRTPAAALPAPKSLAATILEAAKKAAEWVAESWGFETLSEDVETSATNETSLVQYGVLDSHAMLLTGDAGIVSLKEAAALMGRTPGLRFMQVPHHGSRRNVSPSVLDFWLGAKLGQGETRNISAFASAAKEADTHPRKKVVNAFMRRGAQVHATKGQTKCHYNGTDQRPTWVASVPLEFSNMVEA